MTIQDLKKYERNLEDLIPGQKPTQTLSVKLDGGYKGNPRKYYENLFAPINNGNPNG
jgi:hypothetical protein